LVGFLCRGVGAVRRLYDLNADAARLMMVPMPIMSVSLSAVAHSDTEVWFIAKQDPGQKVDTCISRGVGWLFF
jgi:hypothetical protein